MSLAKSRILMEVDYMLSFGAAEASIYLLQRYHLLEILLPVQAAHLAQHDHRRSGQSPVMLMKLLSNLDRLVSCERPSHGCLWVAILTFHVALVNNPQQALVVLTFASLLYHGSWDEGVRFARQHAEAACIYVPETSDCSGPISDDELGERITQFAKHVKDTVNVFTETAKLQETMVKFPGFPCSYLVFVSKKMGGDVKDIFNILTGDVTTLDINRQSSVINYDLLLNGKHCELRFVLGKIILNTLGCGIVSEEEHSKEEKDHLNVLDCHKKREVFLETLPTDLGKCHSTGKKGNKRRALSTSSEQKQELAKKQKVMVRNNYLSEDATNYHEVVTDKWPKDVPIEEQDFFKDDYCLRTAKKNRAMLAAGIDTAFQNYSRRTQERRETYELRIKKSVLETAKYKMTQPGHNHQENKEITGICHLKCLKMLNGEDISKQRNSRDKYLQQQDSSEQSESDKRTTLSQTKESLKKDVNGKQARIEHKRSHEILSSLFR